jgi:pimeloyl-ACP methyl ester carboxylesterase
MGELNAEEIEIAAQGFDVLRDHLREQADNELLGTPEEMREGMASLLAPVDQEALTDELAEYLAAQFREAVQHGVEGWTDESLSDFLAWGFEVEEITVPVQLWHGEQDRFVPVGHGRWLAGHIPGVDARILPDLGHISLITSRTPDAHAWLAERLAD